MTKAADKIIVALDVPTKNAALELVTQLSGKISFFKIGLQLYTAEGPEIVRAVLATGAKVFLDLKLHDIPNTVARAVESAANLGVQMLTIHLSGGSEMIRAATAARANNISILGVSVLTSATEQTLREERALILGLETTREVRVELLAVAFTVGTRYFARELLETLFREELQMLKEAIPSTAKAARNQSITGGIRR